MQAIKDFIAANKKLIIIGIGIVLLLFFTFSSKKTTDTSEKQTGPSKGNVSTEERQRAEIEVLKKSIDEIKKQLPDKTKPDTTAPVKQEKTEGFPKEGLLEKKSPSPFFDMTKVLGKQDTSTGFPTTSPLPVVPTPSDPRISKHDFADDSPKPVPEAVVNQDVFLPAGSFASFSLTSGTYAPDGQTQMPVSGVIDMAFIGPNKSRIPLRGCLFLGKAAGNIAEGLADIKVVKISCVWPNGQSFESNVAGYVTDTSGDFGLKGNVNKHEGGFFSTIGITSFLSGLTSGLAKSQVVKTVVAGTGGAGPLQGEIVSGSPTKFGIMSGATEFANATKGFYAGMPQAVPSVDVPAGARGYIYFTNGITITGGKQALNANTKAYYDNYNLSAVK